MKKSRRAAAYEDIEALPVGWVGEILEDELVASPRPAMPHARVRLALSALWGMAFDLGQPETRGGWWLLYEPELHLGGNILVPGGAASGCRFPPSRTPPSPRSLRAGSARSSPPRP